MSTFSLNKQLAFIAILFVLFSALVVFQIYYNHNVQQEIISRLITSHKIIGDYLALEESESAILDRIRALSDGAKPVSEEECKTLADANTDWFKKLQIWQESLKLWQDMVGIESTDKIFSPDFADLKHRQADAYAKAIQLCKEGKLKDAGYIVNIERSFRPSIHRSIIAVLDGIKLQIEGDSNTLRRFFAGSAMALLVALLVLIVSSAGVFRNLIVSLSSLEDGASRIAKGDFSLNIPQIKSPVELARLSTAFNGMQTAVKTRDIKIREDNEEIRKLNESLERKVVERNKTIMQQNIALTRKNQELEQVLYAASHDLRTPLIGIQGFSEELKLTCSDLVKALRAPGGPNQKEIDRIIAEDIDMALKHIINGSKRMEILLEGLLRISRMGRESLQMQSINMNELVKNVAAGFDYQLHEMGASITIADLGTCMADPSQFEQVFTNLIGNAIKYRDPSRKLDIQVAAEQDNDFIRFSVKDNGIGISREHLDRVFHAFFRVDTEKVEGDGVGLAIVNRALDLHGGRAWVDSELGKGSTFFIEIPKNNFPTQKT